MKQICQVQMNSSDLSYGLFLKVKCQERTERASSCGSWLTALHLAIKRRGNCNDLCSMISFSLQLLHKEWRSHTSGHSKLQDQMSGQQSNVKRTKCDKSNFVSEDGVFFSPFLSFLRAQSLFNLQNDEFKFHLWSFKWLNILLLNFIMFSVGENHAKIKSNISFEVNLN